MSEEDYLWRITQGVDDPDPVLQLGQVLRDLPELTVFPVIAETLSHVVTYIFKACIEDASTQIVNENDFIVDNEEDLSFE